MPGLMPTTAPSPEGPGSPMPFEGDGEIAGAEEQEQYDLFVGMSAMALYDRDAMGDAMAMLSEAPDRVQGVAEVASAIVLRVLEAAREKGEAIGGDVLLHGGREVVELVVELAERAGGDMSEEEAERAFYTAADIVKRRLQEAGDYTDDDAAADAEALRAMDPEGRLAARVRGEGKPSQAMTVSPQPARGLMPMGAG